MNEMETVSKVKKLLEHKKEVEESIDTLATDKAENVAVIVLRDRYAHDHYLFGYNSDFVDKKRVYKKIKYLLLAEMQETLDEINAEIDSLVEFKKVNE